MADTPTNEDSTCIQCQACIPATGKRGPARVFCAECKHARNRESTRLHFAKQRLAQGKVKRREGMADHHTILLDAIKRYVVNPKRQCIDCGKAMGRTVPFGDRCDECGSSRNEAILRQCRSARKVKVRDGQFDPFEVFTTAKWKCHYCGVPTPREHRGGVKPTAPEIDHLLPISRGGSHNRQNVVCACRKCNSDKRCKTPEEFEVWRSARRLQHATQAKGR